MILILWIVQINNILFELQTIIVIIVILHLGQVENIQIFASVSISQYHMSFLSYNPFTMPHVDSQPPVIENCPEHQVIYAGTEGDYGVTTWNVPTATDNHDATVQVVQEEGLTPSSQFPLHPSNVHYVVYGAQDAAGNEAVQCEFSIIVQRKNQRNTEIV